MTGGRDFESVMTKTLNNYYVTNNIKAIAYRHYEYLKHQQLYDVFSDSRSRPFYLAVECKSMDYSRKQKLYFDRFNMSAKDGHQIERETEFLLKSGRTGILAVHLYNIDGRKNAIVMIPWREVSDIYGSGVKGIDLRDFDKYTCMYRVSGKYVLTNDIVSDISEI